MDKMNDNSPAHPKYKLTYFTLRGLGESIRFIFAYADVPYEDHRIAQSDWPALKDSYTFAKLPILEVDGQTFHQSVAIARFLGKRFGLGVSDPIKEALLEAAVDNMKDIIIKMRAGMALKTEEAMKESKDFVQTFLETYEELVFDGHLYGTKATNWYEIYFTAFSESLLLHNGPDALKKCPRLVSMFEKVKSKESLRKWIETRPMDNFKF